MIDCKKCEDLIQRKLDGDISNSDSAAMDAHMRECTHCRELREDYASVRRMFKDDKPMPAPEDFFARLASRLVEKPRVGFVEGYIVPFILQNRIRFALASFILVLAGFGLLYSYYQQDDTLGGFFEPSTTATEAYIGIRSPGEPTFFIPANDGGYIVDEEKDTFKEIEEFFGKGIHLATD